MRTTVEDIKRWIDKANEKGSSHMLVMCDQFDYDDYPVFVSTEQDVQEEADKRDGHNMQKLMEIYSFTGNHKIEDQLRERFSMHYD